MTEHIIRLRGGWELREPASDTFRRVALPLNLPAEAGPGVLLVRPFNRPPIDPATESVWLQLQRVPGLRSIRLNGQEIVRPDAVASELSVLLQTLRPARNVLILELGSIARPELAPADPTWGDVALVIKTEPA